MAECLAAASASAQHGFCKFFKAQIKKNVNGVINSSEGSDILVFNCYLCHVRYFICFFVGVTKIGENSDIFKYFENFVSQTLGVLKRIYAVELRIYTLPQLNTYPRQNEQHHRTYFRKRDFFAHFHCCFHCCVFVFRSLLIKEDKS